MSDNVTGTPQATGTGGKQPTEGPSYWRTAAIAGVVGGAVAGLIASYAPTKLGFAGVFVVLLFAMGASPESAAKLWQSSYLQF